MNNTNILPFGQTQELPAGYPIADDLETNSAQQALSAKQGKRLGDYLFAKGYAAVTLPAAIDGFITGYGTSGTGTWDNKWTTVGKCILLPCEAGDELRLTAKDGAGFSYAVLTSDSHSSQSTPSYASGYDRVIYVSAGSSVDVTIPSGGKYLYVSAQVPNTEKDCTPIVTTEADVAEINEKIAEVAGGEVGKAQGKFAILIAAADAPDWQKANADVVCTGVHDEETIQSVINGLGSQGGKIILSAGNFWIDGFPNVRSHSPKYCAIMFPQNGTEYHIEGATYNYLYSKRVPGDTDQRGGTCINVSESCYTNLDSTKEYCIIGVQTATNGQSMSSNVGLRMEKLHINLASNQKKIMCVDCLYVARVYLELINCTAYINGMFGQAYDTVHPNPIAAPGCVGFRGLGGAVWGTCSDFRNLNACGFYSGFQLGGEHLVCVNLGTSRCYRGYSFNEYNPHGPVGHGAVLINCSDEQSNCGPYFGKWSIVEQIDMICWNEERGGSCYAYDPNDPEQVAANDGNHNGKRLMNATEAYKTDNSGNYLDNNGNITTDPAQYVPRNAVHGRIDYTVYTSAAINSEGESFWEPGFGYGTISKNMAHKLKYPSTTLTNSGFKCDYMERFWATDLNKEVICISTNPKTLVDLNGNQI